MKNLICTLTLFCCCFQLTNAQSTDRFIRIVGVSNHEFIADGIKAEFTVSEIAGNENRNISPMSYESVYSGFIEALGTIGIKESQLTRSEVINPRSGVTAKTYALLLDNPQKMYDLEGLKYPEGARMNSIIYTYSAIDAAIEQQMITQAIDDAKRKAGNICRQIDMQLGKMLNIEDASAGCCGEIKDSKERSTIKTYNVNVTFELKD